MIRRKNVDGSLDVELRVPVMLSNGCGATCPLRHYRLLPNGEIEYFYFETYGKDHDPDDYWQKVERDAPTKWGRNVPGSLSDHVWSFPDVSASVEAEGMEKGDDHGRVDHSLDAKTTRLLVRQSSERFDKMVCKGVHFDFGE